MACPMANGEEQEVVRIVVDIEPKEDDLFIVKEMVAMALEKFGRVRVVSVIRDGKEQK